MRAIRRRATSIRRVSNDGASRARCANGRLLMVVFYASLAPSHRARARDRTIPEARAPRHKKGDSRSVATGFDDARRSTMVRSLAQRANADCTKGSVTFNGSGARAGGVQGVGADSRAPMVTLDAPRMSAAALDGARAPLASGAPASAANGVPSAPRAVASSPGASGEDAAPRKKQVVLYKAGRTKKRKKKHSSTHSSTNKRSGEYGGEITAATGDVTAALTSPGSASAVGSAVTRSLGPPTLEVEMTKRRRVTDPEAPNVAIPDREGGETAAACDSSVAVQATARVAGPSKSRKSKKAVVRSARSALTDLVYQRRKQAGISAEQAKALAIERDRCRRETNARVVYRKVEVVRIEEERAKGLFFTWPNFHASQILDEASSWAATRLSESSIRSYRSYWKKLLLWQFRDYLKEPNDRLHPYLFCSTQIKRFVSECFAPHQRALDECERHDLNSDLRFGTGGLKSARTALVAWFEFARSRDSAQIALASSRLTEATSTGDKVASANALNAQSNVLYMLTLPAERNSLDVHKLGIWNNTKREGTLYSRSIASGGKVSGQFGRPAEILGSVNTTENDTIASYLAQARTRDATGFTALQTVSAYIALAEGFFARPGDVDELKLANVGVVSSVDMPASLVAPPMVWVMFDAHKGSIDTAKPAFKWAIRHRDVRRCPVFHLMESIAVNFHFLGVPLVNIVERDTSHERARKYSKSVDADVLLSRAPVKMISWHGRHVFFQGRSGVAATWTDEHPFDAVVGEDLELRRAKKLRKASAKKSTAREREIDDFMKGNNSTIAKSLCSIRKEEYVLTQGESRVVNTHLMHRRGAAANRALRHGANHDGVEKLGGWDRPDVMAAHYIMYPEHSALVAAAGCDGNRLLYYLDYCRDDLVVPASLQKRLFPWIEQVEEQVKHFQAEGWPDALQDAKIENMIEFLRHARVALWQDWALLRALDERDFPKNFEPSEDWSFWTSGFFQEAREEWTSLCEVAKSRVAKQLRVPEHIQVLEAGGSLDTLQRLAYQTAERIRTVATDVERGTNATNATNAKCDAITCAMEAMQKRMDDLTRCVLANSAGGNVGVMATVTASPAATATVTASPAPPPTIDDLKDLGAKSVTSVMEANLAEAVDAWFQFEQLGAHAGLDVPARKHVNDRKYQHALWYRALSRWAEDMTHGAAGSTHRKTLAYADLLVKAKTNGPADGIRGIYNDFVNDLKHARSVTGVPKEVIIQRQVTALINKFTALVYPMSTTQ